MHKNFEIETPLDLCDSLSPAPVFQCWEVGPVGGVWVMATELSGMD
jgi:hypothetical protein